ncbi:MAG: hypothetical protein ACYTFA_00280 [Planctomycetota bacterium]|jgi:hypothetical protein
MRLRHRTNLAAVFVAFTAIPLCFAIDPQPTETKQEELSVPTSPTATATIEQILETAVRNIARRYNLNEAQTQFTDEIMKMQVKKFLLEHEDEVWPVIRDLLSAQALGGPPDDVELMKRIGKAAGPLAELAQKAIFEANAEWRKILTDQQKELHDYDLAEMEKNFEGIYGRLKSWEQGKRTDQGIFPPAEPPGKGPRRPRKPPNEPLSEGPPVVHINIPTLFDTFVEEFIKDYRLDESQIDTARSILKEFKAKANNIKNAKKHEFAKLAGETKKAIDDRNRAKLREVEAARKKLLEPVYELFTQMEGRLKGLLTTMQRERYSAANRAEPEAKPKPKVQGSKSSPDTATTPAKRKLTSSKKASKASESER